MLSFAATNSLAYSCLVAPSLRALLTSASSPLVAFVHTFLMSANLIQQNSIVLTETISISMSRTLFAWERMNTCWRMPGLIIDLPSILFIFMNINYRPPPCSICVRFCCNWCFIDVQNLSLLLFFNVQNVGLSSDFITGAKSQMTDLNFLGAWQSIGSDHFQANFFNVTLGVVFVGCPSRPVIPPWQPSALPSWW